MQISQRPALSADDHAVEVVRSGSGRFQSKELRDEVAKLLREHNDLTVHRSSISGQNLHPEYVNDYVGQLETGFGNTQYQMYWSRLYEINIVRARR